MSTAMNISTPMTRGSSLLRDGAPVDPRRSDASDRQRRFASVMATAQRREGPKLSPEQQARESAEQLVAIAFIQPILSEMRAADNAAPPFKATQGEKQFRSLWDAQVAQDMVKASHFPLVEKIAESMLRHEAELPEETAQ